MKIIELSDDPNKILEETDDDILSLFYFTASWCGPCKRIYPLLLDLENKMNENKKDEKKDVIFYKIDIDENEEYLETLDISSVPTFYLYEKKELLGETKGADIKKVGELILNNIYK